MAGVDGGVGDTIVEVEADEDSGRTAIRIVGEAILSTRVPQAMARTHTGTTGETMVGVTEETMEMTEAETEEDMVAAEEAIRINKGVATTLVLLINPRPHPRLNSMVGMVDTMGAAELQEAIELRKAMVDMVEAEVGRQRTTQGMDKVPGMEDMEVVEVAMVLLLLLLPLVAMDPVVGMEATALPLVVRPRTARLPTATMHLTMRVVEAGEDMGTKI